MNNIVIEVTNSVALNNRVVRWTPNGYITILRFSEAEKAIEFAKAMIEQEKVVLSETHDYAVLDEKGWTIWDSND